MREDVKEAWVGALRSGNYSQTRGALHRVVGDDEEGGVGYCCLGVLCDVLIKGDFELEQPLVEDPVDDYDEVKWFTYGDNRSAAFLDLDLERELGLDEKFVSTLMELNDSGVPFVEIADNIEEKA